MHSSKKILLYTLLTIAALSILISGCGRNNVAKVNNRNITKDEYHKRLEQLQLPGMPAEAGAIVLQRIINEELILGLAKEEGVTPTEDQVKERIAETKKGQEGFEKKLKDAGISDEQFTQAMRVKQAEFNLVTKGVKVTDEEVKKYYEDHKKDQFTRPEQAEVAAIIAKNDSDAGKALALLQKGIDFGSVAREISIDKQTAAQDGKIPVPVIRGTGSFPQQIQDAVFSTEQGKFTEPVTLTGGQSAIFKVLHRVPESLIAFADVEYGIRQQLMLTKGSERNPDIDAKLEKYRDDSKITIAIPRYEEQLLQKRVGMSAPGAQQPRIAPTPAPAPEKE